MTPEEMAATHAAAFASGRPWSIRAFSDLIKSPGVILCGDVKSFILGRVILDEAELLTVATAPRFQRMGLADDVLSKFVRQAKTQGAIEIFLEVAADNTPLKPCIKSIIS